MMVKRILVGGARCAPAIRSLLLTALLVFGLSLPVYAQDDEQSAIATATNHPVFAVGLANYEGWTAAAYDSNNIYGIWRVQFWDADGKELAWADVNPIRGRVYSYEAYFRASEAQIAAAEPVLREYITTNPDILALIEDPGQYDFNIVYDPRSKWWRVTIYMSENSLYIIVKFDGITPNSFENPQIIGIYFPNVMPYADWQEASQAEAIALAFQNSEISAALSSAGEWTTQTERLAGTLWRVAFVQGDTLLAEVTVDLEADAIVEYRIE
jgi:hypothetical protein